MAEVQLVVFGLNSILCGADTAQIQEIVRYQEIVHLPKMPKFVDGVINLRGKVIPVINLNNRFEMGENIVTKKTKIIITKAYEMLIGYMVNDVLEITKLPQENIEAASDVLHKVGNVYLKSVGIREGKLIMILDLTGILSDHELQNLKRDEESSQ